MEQYTMKANVFSEFIKYIEEIFSPDVVDDIIDVTGQPSVAAFTATGTYQYTDLLRLVAAISKKSSVSIPELVRSFGKHFFTRLSQACPQCLDGVKSSLEFVQRIEGHIHVEVLKLYPDAELPHFECDSHQPNRLTIVYRSQRPLVDLAEGLMEGCAEHFGERIRIEREYLVDEAHSAVHFLLTRRD